MILATLTCSSCGRVETLNLRDCRVVYRFAVDCVQRWLYPTLKVYDREGGRCLNVRSEAWKKAPIVRFRPWFSTADRN